MNTPRIGDTVHYTSLGSAPTPNGTQLYPPRCRAAIVTNTTSHDGDPLTLHILSPNGQHDDTVHSDPSAGWEDFTPGTWHHLH